MEGMYFMRVPVESELFKMPLPPRTQLSPHGFLSDTLGSALVLTDRHSVDLPFLFFNWFALKGDGMPSRRPKDDTNGCHCWQKN